MMTKAMRTTINKYDDDLYLQLFTRLPRERDQTA